MKTFVLIGNFGVANLGDEALHEYFVTAFPEVRWITVSANPKAGEYHRLPAGFRSLFSLGWIRTVQAIRRSDGVVFGGGTLFTDIESLRAPFLWWIHAVTARLLGRPCIFAFQGIGPFRTKAGEWFARSALKENAHISVRDALSYQRCETLIKSNKCIQSFDPVFSLLKNKKLDVSTKKVLGVIPRKNSAATLRNSVIERTRKTQFDSIVILSLQPDDDVEMDYCLTLAQEVGATVKSVRTVDELAEYVGVCSHVVTERYHGAIAALALRVPFETVSQKEGDKLSTVSSYAYEDCQELVQAGEVALRQVLNS